MNKQNRKLPRLRGFDYATPGAYFLTICTHNKQCLFGQIISDGQNGSCMRYSPIGEIARQCLLDIECHYDCVKVDNWIIMPNHIHLLVRVEENGNMPGAGIKYDMSNVVVKYKAAVTRLAGNTFTHSNKLWQSSFFDHIIRNELDYQKIWEYISGNPSKWLEDCFYCE